MLLNVSKKRQVTNNLITEGKHEVEMNKFINGDMTDDEMNNFINGDMFDGDEQFIKAEMYYTGLIIDEATRSKLVFYNQY